MLLLRSKSSGTRRAWALEGRRQCITTGAPVPSEHVGAKRQRVNEEEALQRQQQQHRGRPPVATERLIARQCLLTNYLSSLRGLPMLLQCHCAHAGEWPTRTHTRAMQTQFWIATKADGIETASARARTRPSTGPAGLPAGAAPWAASPGSKPGEIRLLHSACAMQSTVSKRTLQEAFDSC